MTHQNINTFTKELTEEILESVPKLIWVLINNVKHIERYRYLRADKFKRTTDREYHAHGFNPKRFKTRLIEITFAVTQDRKGGLYPSILDKRLRSERALVATMAEMYACTVPQTHVSRESPLEMYRPTQ